MHGRPGPDAPHPAAPTVMTNARRLPNGARKGTVDTSQDEEKDQRRNGGSAVEPAVESRRLCRCPCGVAGVATGDMHRRMKIREDVTLNARH